MDEKKMLELEIKAREYLYKKLKAVRQRLSKQAEAKLTERKVEVENARQYKSIEEAHTMYGYGFITEEEFNKIKELFETGDKKILNDLSAEEAALKIFDNFLGNLSYSIRSFKADLSVLDEK